jgi:hypothetical protein
MRQDLIEDEDLRFGLCHAKRMNIGRATDGQPSHRDKLMA